jgi:hypothetical protein
MSRQLATDHVIRRKPHDELCTGVPVHDAALAVHGENRVVLHRVHELIEQRLAVRRRRLTGIGILRARPPAAIPGAGSK